MAKAKAKQQTAPWVNRIVGYGEEAPDQLLANPLNWRVHPKPQQDALSGVLHDVGIVQNVIVNKTTGHMVDGHLRVSLALREGQPTVPITYVDLSPSEEAEVLATLDPLGAMAATDAVKLDELLRDVNSGSAAVTQMLAELADKAGLQYGAQAEESTDVDALVDKAAELQTKWQVKRGDIWQVGRHRLMCGDSTSKDDVARLMDGAKAMLFATDPPYGIDYDSAQLHRNVTHYDAIEHDELKDEKYQAWLETVFLLWADHLAENAAWYLWHPMLTQGYFAAAAAAAAVIISRQIIWVKPQFIFGRGEYHWMHELCFYGWRKGHRPPFYGERNQTTIWEIGYAGKRNDRAHPTEKPTELWHSPMKNHTTATDVCAEPFSGSGAQLVAGEQMNRTVYAMEMMEKYVAVALERLSLLGLEAKRL